MKRIAFASIILLALTISCVPTPTTQPHVALATMTVAPTGTPTLTPTQTLSHTATPTFTSIPTVTPSPRPTATPTPAITPLALPLFRNIDVKSIPQQVFGKENVWVLVDGVWYSNAGVVGKDTVLERLPNYPGFDGAVVHVKVDSPSPIDSMQRPYIAVEGDGSTRGIWAVEKSQIILQAPNQLRNSGWHRHPIVSLISVGWHPNNVRKDFRMVAGIRLLTDDGQEYFVTTYTVNKDGSTIDGQRKVPYRIKTKQILRTELYYQTGKPYVRAFIKDGTPNATFVYINEMPLDETGENVIEQYITWLGIYPGRDVTGLEVIEGELKIYAHR